MTEFSATSGEDFPLKLSYIYSFRDYLAINRAKSKNRKSTRFYRAAIVLVILLNLLATCYFLYQVFGLGFHWESWMVISPAAAALLTLKILVAEPLMLRRYYRQQLLDGKSIDLEVNDQGIVYASDGVRGETDWPRIIRTDEEPDHFLIWVTHTNAFSVPKRAFSNPEEMQDFRNLIRKNQQQ